MVMIYEGEQSPYRGRIKPEFIAKARRMYDKYKADKEQLHNRIIDNNRWYKAQYGKIIDPRSNETQPATAFIFSAIENKYADAIDNYPVPNLLEREPSDTETAKLLSKIIPVQLDMSGFKGVYKDNWRRKLKHGTAVYGVFYNERSEDIDIRAIELMNIYCDMRVRDVQDSQFLFISNAVDNDVLREEYPAFKALFHGDADVLSYSGRHRLEDRTEIIDCYYKKTDGTLHMMKIAGNTIIDATEDTEGYENGLYEHGRYPVVFDVLYPEEDSPFGFGIVDIIRNPQQYIDKLDGIIIKNSLIAGKTRYFIKEGCGINEKEFTDMSRDIVHTAGNVTEDNVRRIDADALPKQVLEHRLEKITELKEVIGNRDFQQGGTAGNVTAASAINSLQQTGQKLSRAIIDDSHDAYRRIVIMMIDLMREFYSRERIYRITNDIGGKDFASFDGSMLTAVQYERDALGFITDVKYKKTEFDIDVIPERENPATKESGNATIMNLWNSGFFIPQNFDVSLIALQLMNFDGKDKAIEQIKQLQKEMEQTAQQQMPKQQIPKEQAADEVSKPQPAGQGGFVPVGRYGGENNKYDTFGEPQQLQGGQDQLVPVGRFGENQ